MQLSTFLQVAGISRTEFARRLGVKYTTVYRWMTEGPERRVPDPESMRRIFAASSGAVTANDFYDLGAIAPSEKSLDEIKAPLASGRRAINKR